jgi:hypothetical protein
MFGLVLIRNVTPMAILLGSVWAGLGCVLEEPVEEASSEDASHYVTEDFALARSPLAIDRSTFELSTQVLGVLKTQYDRDESQIMTRWVDTLQLALHAQTIAEVKTYYEEQGHYDFVVQRGWTPSFDRLSEERKAQVFRRYQESTAFWTAVGSTRDLLTEAIKSIEPCEDCTLPRNAPQLLWHMQLLAYRAQRAGAITPPSEAACLYLEALQSLFQARLQIQDLSRTGISLPKRPPIEYLMDADL